MRSFVFILLSILPDELYSVNYDGIQLSCYGATSRDNSNNFCSFASWQAAQAFFPANYSVYSPGPALSLTAQNDYAIHLYNQLGNWI